MTDLTQQQCDEARAVTDAMLKTCARLADDFKRMAEAKREAEAALSPDQAEKEAK